MKNSRDERPKVGTLDYYIDEVVGYRAKCERGEDLEKGYPPVVAELLLSILISVRSLRLVLLPLGGLLLGLLIKLLLEG